MRGGLGLTNVAGSMLFGGISGTAVADAASIGGMMIPGMKKAGYPADFSAAITAASSTVGPMIPPSVPMIIVGALSGISVGKMFLAGAVPGILMGLAMMVTCYIIAVRRDFPRQPWAGFGELGRSFLGAFWAIAMTALIIGGLLSGLATPTETAIVASVYALVGRAAGLSRAADPAACPRSSSTAPSPRPRSWSSSASPTSSAGSSSPSASRRRSPTRCSRSPTNKYLVILLINLLLLFVGMFMETIAALIILFVPLLTLAQGVGIDPLHFATFAVLNLMIGLTTPPVGVCLFICANIARAAADAGHRRHRAVPADQHPGAAAGLLRAAARDLAAQHR